MKGLNHQQLAAVCLLCASSTWAESVPSGAVAEYYTNCSHATSNLETDCAEFIARLEALEWKKRDEELALLWSRKAMASFRDEEFSEEEFCAEARSIVISHPDYAEAVYNLVHCTDVLDDTIALLRKALEFEPDNFRMLDLLLLQVEGWDPSAHVVPGVDRGVEPEALDAYRHALYEAAKTHVAWEASVAPEDSVSSELIYSELFSAARYIYFAAIRAGDHDAAEALQIRVRQDAGLDDLDYSAEGSCPYAWKDCRRGSGEDNFALACHVLLSSIGLENVCVSAVERLMSEAAARGLAAPANVLKEVERTVENLRDLACGKTVLVGDECHGSEATETVAVAGLREILRNYDGEWSSEHHRVHAQAFLGDGERLDGLHTALKVDPGNTRARCELARALMARERTAEARILLGDGDPKCLESPRRGFTWVDRDAFVIWLEREREWE